MGAYLKEERKVGNSVSASWQVPPTQYIKTFQSGIILGEEGIILLIACCDQAATVAEDIVLLIYAERLGWREGILRFWVSLIVVY